MFGNEPNFPIISDIKILKEKLNALFPEPEILALVTKIEIGVTQEIFQNRKACRIDSPDDCAEESESRRVVSGANNSLQNGMYKIFH